MANNNKEKPMSDPAERKTVLAKKEKAKDAKAEKESALAKLKQAHNELAVKIKALEKNGKKISSSVKELFTTNGFILNNAKPSNSKFDDEMLKVQRRIDSIKSQLESGAAETQEPDKLHQDIKKLEAEAATEDKEFAINLNHYTESAEKLNTLFELIKNNNVELDGVDKARQIKLQTLLDGDDGMLNALTAKQYDKFKKPLLHDFTVTFNLLNFNVKEKLKRREVKPVESEQKPAEEAKSEKKVESLEFKPESKQQAPEKIDPTHYQKAKAALEELRVGIKKYGYDIDRQTVSDFEARLEELAELEKTNQYEEFKNKYNAFNKDVRLLISQHKKKEKEPLLRKKENAKTKEAVPSDTQSQPESKASVKTKEQEQKEFEERERRYNVYADKFKLLRKIIKSADKAEGGKRNLRSRYEKELEMMEGYFDDADKVADEPQDSAAFWKIINDFNKDFKEFLENLEPDIKEAYERAEKEGPKPVVAVVEKSAEEAVAPVAKKEAEEVGGITLEDALAQWKLFERIAAKKLSNKEKSQEINELVKRINYGLYLASEAKKANRPNEISEQMKMFKPSFNELLSKIPEDAKNEFESQLSGNVPSGEEAKEKVILAKQESSIIVDSKDLIEKGKLKVRFFNGIFAKLQDKMRFLNKIPRVQQIKRDADNYLRQVSVALDNKDKDAYLKHTEQLTQLINELIGFFPKEAKQEYLGILNGEETEGLKKERQEHLGEVKFQEERVMFLEKLLNASDAALGVKFASEIKSMKDALVEASVNFGNEPENIVKEADVFSEKRSFVLSAIATILSSIGGDAQKKIKRDFYKKFPQDSLVQHNALIGQTEVVPSEPQKLVSEVKTSEAGPVAAGEIFAAKEKSPDRKKRIIDVSERDLLNIIGEKKLQEVVSEIILGNKDVAEVLMKDIFSRKDIDLENLNGALEKFGYTPAQFMKEWSENLHRSAFENINKWVEQLTRGWLNKNISWWDKLKQNPIAYAKLGAVNILPSMALVGGIGLALATGGASTVTRGAVVGGASGLLRGLKKKVDSVRGWFSKRSENARADINAGKESIEEKKAIPLRDSLLAQFTGENGPEMMEQLSSMLSQGLREASASEVLKANAELALTEVGERIEKEFEEIKARSNQETAVEIKRSQEERAKVLIEKLYEDKDLEKLIREVIDKDPKIVEKLKKLKIFDLDFSKFVNEENKNPEKKESDLKKVASILASTAVGASIGGALAAAPELRAVLGAITGGYLGAKFGHLKDRKAREQMFEKEFTDKITQAEKWIEQYEQKSRNPEALAAWLAVSENLNQLTAHAKDLRTPLTLGILEQNINLQLRAKNVLRRTEALQINLYINQNPRAEEMLVPEAQRNSGVEKLLAGWNTELENLTKEQQNFKDKITRKPGWWRAVGYGIGGAVTGAGLGYGTAKFQEYMRGRNHQLLDTKPQPQTSAGLPAQSETAIPPETPAVEHHEVLPIPTEMVEHGNHTVAVVELNNKEGILNGVNKIIHNNPNVFVHENGKAWSDHEIHAWKVRELKDIGFKIEGDKWGNPMTVHGGAKVEVFTDETGRPHFKLASEEHVTFNKNYHWTDTKSVDHAVTEHANKADKLINPYPDNKADQLINPYPDNKADQLINPYSENNGVGVVVEPAAAHAPTANADVVAEHPIAHKEVRVDSDIKERAVVHRAEETGKGVSGVESRNEKPVQENIVPAKSAAVAPEKAPVAAEAPPETVGQFLREHNSNTADFVATYNKMIDAAVDRFEAKFNFRADADEFLDGKFKALYSKAGITEESFRADNQIDKGSLGTIEKLLNAETQFNSKQPNWLKTFTDSMFSKDDKSMDLVLAPDRDVTANPIFTNGSHAARVWDPTANKDVLVYDKDYVFTKKAGKLVAEYKNGTKTSYSQKEFIELPKTK